MIKNIILKTITVIMIVIVTLGVISLDSDSLIPYFMTFLPFVWLLPYAKANGATLF